MNAEKEAAPESLLRFPCPFPIKVMGHHDGKFEALVTGMISSHTGPISPTSIESRQSRNGRFLAVTVTIIAESQAQLDAIYRTLTACDQVLYAF